jgi:tetratricopeptide (TPR) repeat protein
MDRRPYVVAGVVSAASLAVAVGTVVLHRSAPPAEAAGAQEKASCGMALGRSAASLLPKDTELMPGSAEAEFTGKALCGHCTWGIGDSCNTVLWDKEHRHAVMLLPGEQLTEAQKLVGTCAGGTQTVTVRGALTQYRGMNYLLPASFQTAAKPKEAPTTEVGKLVAEGVEARYQKKDLAAAEAAWRKALGMLGAPDATPLDRYQAYAGLGLLHAERKEYAQARELFGKAAQAAKDITDTPRPRAYSHYNMGCAEGLLGEQDAAFANLKLALEAEAEQARQRYVKMSQTDECYAALRKEERFEVLLTQHER